MNDFLSQLISHQFESTTALRPRPTSLFESSLVAGARPQSGSIFKEGNLEQAEFDEQATFTAVEDAKRQGKDDELDQLTAALQQIRRQLSDTMAEYGPESVAQRNAEASRNSRDSQQIAEPPIFPPLETKLAMIRQVTPLITLNSETSAVNRSQSVFAAENSNSTHPVHNRRSHTATIEPVVVLDSGESEERPAVTPRIPNSQPVMPAHPVDGIQSMDSGQQTGRRSAPPAQRTGNTEETFADKNGETAPKKISRSKELKPIQFPEDHGMSIPQQTVQVTIGRVEIRATPAAGKSKPQAAAKPAALSLDEYLSKRNGERR